MKIKAKKINSASENAIQSSVFVFQWKPVVTNLTWQEDKYFTPRVSCVGVLCNKWTLSSWKEGHQNRIFNKHLPKQANAMHVSNSWQPINLIEIII